MKQKMIREGNDLIAFYRKENKEKDFTLISFPIMLIAIIAIVSCFAIIGAFTHSQEKECQDKGGVYQHFKYRSVCFSKNVIIELND